MNTRRMSEHLALECAHVVRVRRGQAEPLEDLDPVPGCPCVRCVLLAYDRKAGLAPGALEVLLHQVLPSLAERIPDERLAVAERLRSDWIHAALIDLPPAAFLCRLASKMPNARQAPRPVIHDDDPLPIEAARGADILDTCERLGIELRRTGRSWRGSCPLHDSTSGTSFSVDPAKGLYHCFGCGAGGDVIDLYRRVTGVRFVDVVRELAG